MKGLSSRIVYDDIFRVLQWVDDMFSVFLSFFLGEERNLSSEENFKLMQEVRKNTYASSSLVTTREKDNNTLKIAIDDK